MYYSVLPKHAWHFIPHITNGSKNYTLCVWSSYEECGVQAVLVSVWVRDSLPQQIQLCVLFWNMHSYVWLCRNHLVWVTPAYSPAWLTLWYWLLLIVICWDFTPPVICALYCLGYLIISKPLSGILRSVSPRDPWGTTPQLYYNCSFTATFGESPISWVLMHFSCVLLILKHRDKSN